MQRQSGGSEQVLLEQRQEAGPCITRITLTITSTILITLTITTSIRITLTITTSITSTILITLTITTSITSTILISARLCTGKSIASKSAVQVRSEEQQHPHLDCRPSAGRRIGQQRRGTGMEQQRRRHGDRSTGVMLQQRGAVEPGHVHAQCLLG